MLLLRRADFLIAHEDRFTLLTPQTRTAQVALETFSCGVWCGRSYFIPRGQAGDVLNSLLVDGFRARRAAA
jgi:hypothetical protein